MSKREEIFNENAGIFKKFTFIFVSVLGIGFTPYAPGTLGSAVTIPFVWLILFFTGAKGLAVAALAVFVVGYYFTHAALGYVDDKDPSYIVIDEVIGQMVSFILPSIIFPMFFQNIPFYICGFLLFRLFDILKPWHVGWADEFVEGATGVILDDIFAGIYASIVLTAGIFIYKAFFMAVI